MLFRPRFLRHFALEFHQAFQHGFGAGRATG
ncbi:uncharacterized protein METZ01_LOCUS313714, partial [marine metagenome]